MMAVIMPPAHLVPWDSALQRWDPTSPCKLGGDDFWLLQMCRHQNQGEEEKCLAKWLIWDWVLSPGNRPQPGGRDLFGWGDIPWCRPYGGRWIYITTTSPTTTLGWATAYLRLKKSKFFSCFSFFFFFCQNRKLGMHTIIFQMVGEIWIKYKLAIYIFLVPMKTGYLSMKVERV